MTDREMIERALGQEQFWEHDIDGCATLKLDALAEQAIVLPIKIRHTPSLTFIEYGEGLSWEAIRIRGHHGTPGKYLFIGLPLKEEDGDKE